MIYVLDTDILTLLAHEGSNAAANVRRRIVDLPDDAIATTIVNYEEQIRGWMAYLSSAKTVEAELWLRASKRTYWARDAGYWGLRRGATTKRLKLYESLRRSNEVSGPKKIASRRVGPEMALLLRCRASTTRTA